ncbi:MAG: hypothetical protein HY906_12690 [Deltaproteobacteria bacterium]|nr:hypothetical protein [Deltaproteobacteria bacterium]
MTLEQFFGVAYAWGVAHRLWILIVAVAVPLLGTLLARIGKAGKTDRDGRFIASVVVGIGLLAVLVEMLAIGVGAGVLGQSVLDGDVLLLASPLLCLGGAIVGIRLVFPLNELASVRTAVDVGAFILACAAVVWFFSKFRGWGLLFFGSITQLVLLLVLGYFLVRRLWRRAFGGRPARAPAET